MASNSLKKRDWTKTMKQATRLYIFYINFKSFNLTFPT